MGSWVKLRSQKFELSIDLLCGFTGKFNFKTREPKFEVMAKSVMGLECGIIQSHSNFEDDFPGVELIENFSLRGWHESLVLFKFIL